MPFLIEERHDAAMECKCPPPKPPLKRRAKAKLPKKRALPGQLSPHFHVNEFNCKDGTRVPAAAVPGLKRLCQEVLEPLRKRFGPCQVMSGYRHAAYNRRIGGAKYSQHIYDYDPASVAADLVFSKGTPKQWAAAAEKLLSGRGGIGTYSSFIHVDNRQQKGRWSG